MWDLCSPVFRGTIGELSDSLTEEMVDISETFVISFDDIVHSNVVENPPRSVDALYVTEDAVTFIEFKGWSHFSVGPGCDDKTRSKVREMKDAVAMKAVESIHLYRRFLEGPETADLKTRFILVHSDPTSRIGEILRSHGGRDQSKPDFLRKFEAEDISGTKLFYDEVWECSTAAFERLIGKDRIIMPPQPRPRRKR